MDSSFAFISPDWRDGLQIFFLWIGLYILLRFMQGTRGGGILKGLGLTYVIAFPILFGVARVFNLTIILWVLKALMTVSLIAIIVIFQPEIRQGLVRLGHNPIMRIFFKAKPTIIEEVVKCISQLSGKNIGALIAFERETGLANYAESGVELNSEVTAELLSTIFYPGTVLHDGAVIIRNNRIAAAGCLLPLSENSDISRSLGTRHRAGLGVTEETDAVTVIVSEETGKISLGVRGKLIQGLEVKDIRSRLEELCVPELDTERSEEEVQLEIQKQS